MENNNEIEDPLDQIDSEKLSEASSMRFKIEDSFSDKAATKGEDTKMNQEMLEEITEDLVHILKKMAEFENRMEELFNKTEKIAETTTSNYRKHQVELDQLKRELLGERKAFIHKSVFNNLVTTIDYLYHRKCSISPDKDSSLYSLTTGMLENLQNLLKTMGYEHFVVEKDKPFKSEIMECLGFESGEENKVVSVERLGFKSENIVVRSCGVILGKK